MSIRGWVVGALGMGIYACSGGGDGGGALPSHAEDINPPGERLDLRARNYFPAASGDTWTYDVQRNGAPPVDKATRTATARGDGSFVIEEANSGSRYTSTYRRTAEGIVQIKAFATVPAAMARNIGDLLIYPEPFYSVGSTRTLVRQGEWGHDADDDGFKDSGKFEFAQTFVGIETLDLPSGRLSDVVHFRDVTTLTFLPSSQSFHQSIVSAEETWWAPGIGLARADRSTYDSGTGAVVSVDTIVLTGGTVGGAPILQRPLDGTRVDIELEHSDLVYDAARSRYYACIPGNVPANGNRIAILDSGSGAVTYSPPVGSEPSALAMSSDGAALYVGLSGTGEVLKLRLPDFVEQWRVRLPTVPSYGPTFAAKLAVSPAEPDVLAVSMSSMSNPQHAGVSLVRAGVIKPTTTTAYRTGSLIAFDGNGQYVYTFNKETSDFALGRLQVSPDGLTDDGMVEGDGDFTTSALDWSPSGLLLGRSLYRVPDLALLGRANINSGHCRPLSIPNRLVCLDNQNELGAAIAVVDATTFVVLSKATYHRTTFMSGTMIVPGPAGQIALHMNVRPTNGIAKTVSLFNSPALQ